MSMEAEGILVDDDDSKDVNDESKLIDVPMIDAKDFKEQVPKVVGKILNQLQEGMRSGDLKVDGLSID